VEYLTYRKIAERNPFLPLGFSPYNFYTTTPYHAQLHRDWFFFGVNTALSKTMDFALKGRFIEYKNLLNFDFDTTNVRALYLMPTYQDVNCFQLQANLNYHLDEKFSVSTMARWNRYDKVMRDSVLYKPIFEANFTARYNIQDKIILKTQLYVDAGRYARNFEGDRVKLNGEPNVFVDWSLGAEYRFNRRWGAFAEANNILNLRKGYDLWYGYRSFGLNFLVGATFNL
jgi:hypothetical protein